MENNDNQNNKDKKPKEPGVKLAFWLLRKAKAEGVSFEQLVVYQWIYQKNKTIKEEQVVWGKTSRTKLYECIAQDTGQSADGIEEMCKSLVEKGWMKNANGKAYNGKRTWGYLCLLDAEQAVRAKVGEQMEMAELEKEVQPVVESLHDGKGAEWPGPGVRNQYGNWIYNDANGEAVILPKDGDFPARPSEDAEWWEPEGRWVTLEEYRQLYKEQNR